VLVAAAAVAGCAHDPPAVTISPTTIAPEPAPVAALVPAPAAAPAPAPHSPAKIAQTIATAPTTTPRPDGSQELRDYCKTASGVGCQRASEKREGCFQLTRGVFSIEECRLRDSSASDRIQSVHELERSARARGKECSRSTVRSGGGDRQSGDTWHSRGQLRERDLSKVPHILSTVLQRVRKPCASARLHCSGWGVRKRSGVHLGFWGATDEDPGPGKCGAGIDTEVTSRIRLSATRRSRFHAGAALMPSPAPLRLVSVLPRIPEDAPVETNGRRDPGLRLCGMRDHRQPHGGTGQKAIPM
jgi:hypothetical protein